MTPRRSRAAVAIVLAGVLGVSGACGDGSTSADPDPGPGSEPPATGPEPADVCGEPWPEPDAGQRFVDVAAEACIDVVQHVPNAPDDCLVVYRAIGVDEPRRTCEPERMTGGVAVGDYDGDGRPDLYFTRLDGPGVLYRNEGDGTFTDVTAAAGLDGLDAPSNGAGFADLTNDGHQDLVVTTVTGDRHFLFVNQGDGTFREQGVERGLALDDDVLRVGFSVAFGDYDGDGWLDVHLTEWWPFDHDEPAGASHARLLRNLGAEGRPGHFEDVTDAAGVDLVVPLEGLPTATERANFSLASTFVDLDGDGWPDLAVVADAGASRLFWNEGDGTFADGTEAAGVGTETNGMGSTFGDVDGSGRLDWFVTSIHDDRPECDVPPCSVLRGNRLFRNDGDRRFTDVTDAAGVRDGGWGWGAAFFDHDNSGHLDLVMANGIDLPGHPDAGRHRVEPMRAWIGAGDGTFRDAAAELGFTDDAVTTGLAVVDVDGDGRLDVVVVRNGGSPAVFRNVTDPVGSFVRVVVEGVDSNRDGVGAVVEVQGEPGGVVQVREVGVGSHFLGQSERVVHVGLGAGAGPVHEVRVRWPATGREQVVGDVEPGSTLALREPPR